MQNTAFYISSVQLLIFLPQSRFNQYQLKVLSRFLHLVEYCNVVAYTYYNVYMSYYVAQLWE